MHMCNTNEIKVENHPYIMEKYNLYSYIFNTSKLIEIDCLCANKPYQLNC